MKPVRAALLSFVAMAAILLAPSIARAALPVEASLSAEPAELNWPDRAEFGYRLNVEAGPEGADFGLSFPYPEWGLPGVAGTPFSIGEPTLDGPGKLSPASVMIADPAPTACWRGGFGGSLRSYRLELAPGQRTTLVAPASLLTAPLAGMSSTISAELTGDGKPLEVTGPLSIEGKQGVRIALRASRRTVKKGQRFTLTGRTIPALPHRWVRVRATPRIWERSGKAPKAHMLLTVKTDEEGRFRGRPVSLGSDATWILTSRLRDPAPYDGAASCGGAITTTSGWYRPGWDDLKGSTFVSTKVKGHRLVRRVPTRDGGFRWVRNRVRLTFKRDLRFSPAIPNARNRPRVPYIYAYVGCNSMSGELKLRRGRVRWTKPAMTLIGCRPSHDAWLAGLLDRGVRAAMKGHRLLVLKRGKTKIVLKRRSR